MAPAAAAAAAAVAVAVSALTPTSPLGCVCRRQENEIARGDSARLKLQELFKYVYQTLT